MLTSSTQLQNWSFHVLKERERLRNVKKVKNARAKRAKLLFFRRQTCKFRSRYRRRRGCIRSLLLNKRTATCILLALYNKELKFTEKRPFCFKFHRFDRRHLCVCPPIHHK